jgi:hypothetical protein
MAGKKETLSARLDRLAERLEELEDRLEGGGTASKGVTESRAEGGFCSVPELRELQFGPDVSNERAALIRVISKKWVNGTTLKYHFFRGGRWGTDEAEMATVRKAFDVWKDVGIGLKFREVTTPDEAEVRIGFQRGDGAWSYVGRDVLDRGTNERTMNFGWDVTNDIDTPVHEIGHTLGFPHEHQNPNAGIVWDEPAVIAYFARSPNRWPESKTRYNVIRKIPQDSVDGSEWDKDSIMHYSFGAGLILEPSQYRSTGIRPADGLSEKDRIQVREFYPPLEVAYPELRPFEFKRLEIERGQQVNYSVIPSVSRKYRFRTFGESDTVMVLFEDRDGELEYVKGDDDSGTDRNAMFTVRLAARRRYVLRVRLYWTYSTGDAGLLMW